MPKIVSAQIIRTAKSGAFTVTEVDGTASVHQSGKQTPKVVQQAINKHQNALERLADR